MDGKRKFGAGDRVAYQTEGMAAASLPPKVVEILKEGPVGYEARDESGMVEIVPYSAAMHRVNGTTKTTKASGKLERTCVDCGAVHTRKSPRCEECAVGRDKLHKQASYERCLKARRAEHKQASTATVTSASTATVESVKQVQIKPVPPGLAEEQAAAYEVTPLVALEQEQGRVRRLWRRVMELERALLGVGAPLPPWKQRPAAAAPATSDAQ